MKYFICLYLITITYHLLGYPTLNADTVQRNVDGMDTELCTTSGESRNSSEMMVSASVASSEAHQSNNET